MDSPPSTDPKYSAFISYSHRDRKWGVWLHKELETWRVPRTKETVWRSRSRPGLATYFLLLLAWSSVSLLNSVFAAPALRAGAAQVDITRAGADAGTNPLFAKALVLSDGTRTLAIITIDAVALEEIGSIKSPFVARIREALEQDFSISPSQVLLNASHCHGIVCPDVAERTIQAVKLAHQNLVPVRVGAGSGHENRIMVNRRLILQDGSEVDVRHAYSMPPDEDVAQVGPIDPEIGLLRLERMDGSPLALVYNFACHPIQGIPSRGNTADLTGFASRAIENTLGGGTIALFLQGCAGDINPVNYKAVDRPRDAEPLGNQLALSALKAAQTISCREEATLNMVSHSLQLPRADHSQRIQSLQQEVETLLASLKGTTLNLKTFLPLYVKYRSFPDTPSSYTHRYLQDEKLKTPDWSKLDEVNRHNMEAYLRNIRIMEELTRKQINLALLEKHQQRNAAAGDSITVEVQGLRIGDFRLITFPGELTVQIGLNIKERSPHPHTYVAGYSNGYIYYAPTAQQLRNVGGAQEDSDCLLAPEWQELFEQKAMELLKQL